MGEVFTFTIINKDGERLLGEWDEEGLNFIHAKGEISYNEFIEDWRMETEFDRMDHINKFIIQKRKYGKSGN